MFTGIVEAVGSVTENASYGGGRRLRIDSGDLPLSDIKIGDSVAVNGVCLTVIALQSAELEFDVSQETLNKCLLGDWIAGSRVNLETALTLSTPLGGHLVSGHIDGQGTMVSSNPSGEYIEMTISVPIDLAKFVAVKGSIAIDGVSLTINTVTDLASECRVQMMLVPHTLSQTTLGLLRSTDRVHIEVDMLARYAERISGFLAHSRH
ncbi:MAG: riboflavin synthase [Pseudomonadota bacterium]